MCNIALVLSLGRTKGTRRRCINLLKDINDEDGERLNKGVFGCSTYLLLLDTYSKYIFPFLRLQEHYRDYYGEYWHVHLNCIMRD